MQLSVTPREYDAIQAALHYWRASLRASGAGQDHLDAVEAETLCVRLQAQADPAAQVERLCDLESLQDDLAFLLLLVDRADGLPWLTYGERARLDLIRAEAEDDPAADVAEEMVRHRGPDLGLTDLCPEEKGE